MADKKYINNKWHNIKALYKTHGLLIKLYNFIRMKTCPFDTISACVSNPSEILDLGCGNGLFTNYLSINNETAEVLGVDISEKNISIARQTIKKRNNIQFISGDIASIESIIGTSERFSHILLIDSLYFLPPAEQKNIVRQCSNLLAINGTFLIKTIIKNPRWKYYLCKIQDYIANNILRLHFPARAYVLDAGFLEKTFYEEGFVHMRQVDLSKGYFYPHTLFICKKGYV